MDVCRVVCTAMRISHSASGRLVDLEELSDQDDLDSEVLKSSRPRAEVYALLYTAVLAVCATLAFTCLCAWIPSAQAWQPHLCGWHAPCHVKMLVSVAVCAEQGVRKFAGEPE